jgi:hypothetical protein
MVSMGSVLQKEKEPIKKTLNVLNWNNETSVSSHIITNYENISEENLTTVHIKNLVFIFTDFIGEAYFEVTKWGLSFGYTHPHLNAEKVFGDWFVPITILIIILAVFKPILCIIAIIYVLVYWLVKKTKRGKK